MVNLDSQQDWVEKSLSDQWSSLVSVSVKVFHERIDQGYEDLSSKGHGMSRIKAAKRESLCHGEPPCLPVAVTCELSPICDRLKPQKHDKKKSFLLQVILSHCQGSHMLPETEIYVPGWHLPNALWTVTTSGCLSQSPILQDFFTVPHMAKNQAHPAFNIVSA